MTCRGIATFGCDGSAMRGMIYLAMAGVTLLCSGPALADAQSYCRDYGADIAAMRLTGRAILNPSSASVLSEDERDATASAATADCLARFAPGTKPPAVARRVSATPRTPTGQEPGSDAWKAYCAKKYVSFDPIDGTYKAKSGKRRPCRVSRN